VYPVVLRAGLVALLHAHRNAQWQAGHGFLGLPNRSGYQNYKAGKEGHRHTFGVGEARKTNLAAKGASDEHQKVARRVGPDGRRAVRDGSAVEGRGVRAGCGVCTQRCSPPSVAAFGTAACWAYHGSEAALMGFWCARVVRVQEGACGGASHATSNFEATSKRVTAWSRVELRLLLACVARPPGTACGVGMHLVGHGVRERLRGQNEPAHRTIAWGRVAGDCGWAAGAVRRTLTGATFAASARKRVSSGAQAKSLYMQRPLGNTNPQAFSLPRSYRV
jgi:hypothetical protein